MKKQIVTLQLNGKKSKESLTILMSWHGSRGWRILDVDGGWRGTENWTIFMSVICVSSLNSFDYLESWTIFLIFLYFQKMTVRNFTVTVTVIYKLLPTFHYLSWFCFRERSCEFWEFKKPLKIVLFYVGNVKLLLYIS